MNVNGTHYEMKYLKPYTPYRVSLNAYVFGEVERQGPAESCSFRTKAARKFFALIFVPQMSRNNKCNFHVQCVDLSNLGNTLAWHVC